MDYNWCWCWITWTSFKNCSLCTLHRHFLTFSSSLRRIPMWLPNGVCLWRTLWMSSSSFPPCFPPFEPVLCYCRAKILFQVWRIHLGILESEHLVKLSLYILQNVLPYLRMGLVRSLLRVKLCSCKRFHGFLPLNLVCQYFPALVGDHYVFCPPPLYVRSAHFPQECSLISSIAIKVAINWESELVPKLHLLQSGDDTMRGFYWSNCRCERADVNLARVRVQGKEWWHAHGNLSRRLRPGGGGHVREWLGVPVPIHWIMYLWRGQPSMIYTAAPLSIGTISAPILLIVHLCFQLWKLPKRTQLQSINSLLGIWLKYKAKPSSLTISFNKCPTSATVAILSFLF